MLNNYPNFVVDQNYYTNEINFLWHNYKKKLKWMYLLISVNLYVLQKLNDLYLYFVMQIKSIIDFN